MGVPAVVRINRLVGASPTGGAAGPTYAYPSYYPTGNSPDITSQYVRVDAWDDYSTNTSCPHAIPIPISGTCQSAWCSTQLFFQTAPASEIGNVKWYMTMPAPGYYGPAGGSGSGLGITMIYGQATSYVAWPYPTTSPDGLGPQLSNANYTGGGFTAFAGSPFTNVGGSGGTVGPFSILNAYYITGTSTAPPTLFGNLVVYQFVIAPTCNTGTVATGTMTWQYDEI